MSDHNEGIDQLLSIIDKLHKLLPEDLVFLEVGCYEGDTSLDIIKILHGSERWFFTVDPYGSKPYLLNGGELSGEQTGYTDETYRHAMLKMSGEAYLGTKHVHYRLTSLDFFKLWSSMDFWDGGNRITPEFGFVYLDGAHEPETVGEEVSWLKNHMATGLIVVDDYDFVRELNLEGEEMHGRLYIEIDPDTTNLFSE